MADLQFILLILLFFLAGLGFIAGCQRLLES
jgi:hypothetical protein